MFLENKNTILLITVLVTALSAGIFFAWQVTVIPGTKKISDQSYLETMQSINREILNAGFFVVFFGALIMLLISSIVQYKIDADHSFYLVLVAGVIYAFGTFAVTMFGNVPLNNSLEMLDLSTMTEVALKKARIDYEDKWNTFHLYRTIASVTSMILLLFALLRE